MKKRRKPKQLKKVAALKRLNRQIIGLKMAWQDETPQADKKLANDVYVGHRSKSQLVAQLLWQKNMDYIVNKSQWQWRVVANCIFDNDGEIIEDKASIEQTFVLADSAPIVDQLITQSMQEVFAEHPQATFRYTTFLIECLGYPKQNQESNDGE